jgi:hypothetical protein
MPQWEYTYTTLPAPYRGDQCEAEMAELNRFGQEGWEAYTVITMPIAGQASWVVLLKRPLGG